MSNDAILLLVAIAKVQNLSFYCQRIEGLDRLIALGLFAVQITIRRLQFA